MGACDPHLVELGSPRQPERFSDAEWCELDTNIPLGALGLAFGSCATISSPHRLSNANVSRGRLVVLRLS